MVSSFAQALNYIHNDTLSVTNLKYYVSYTNVFLQILLGFNLYTLTM
jgi:hypothetical protein